MHLDLNQIANGLVALAPVLAAVWRYGRKLGARMEAFDALEKRIGSLDRIEEIAEDIQTHSERMDQIEARLARLAEDLGPVPAGVREISERTQSQDIEVGRLSQLVADLKPGVGRG